MKTKKVTLKEVKAPVVAMLQGPGPHEAPAITAKQVRFFKSVNNKSAATKKLAAMI